MGRGGQKNSANPICEYFPSNLNGSIITPHQTEPPTLSQAGLEKILREHIAKFGVDVELGIALIGIEQNDAIVTARLVREGVEELFECQYVIGADGAKGENHSSYTHASVNVRFWSGIIRKLVGLPFIGQSIQGDRMLTANVKADFNREVSSTWISAIL